MVSLLLMTRRGLLRVGTMGICPYDPTSRVKVLEDTAPELLTCELAKGGAQAQRGC